MKSLARLPLPLAFTLMIISPFSAPASEPAVNLGFTSFLDGGPPAGPGWYYTQYIQYYTADKIAADGGAEAQLPLHLPPAGPDDFTTGGVDAWILLFQAIYHSDKTLLWASKWGLDLILPYVEFDAEPDRVPVLSDSSGWGDLLVGPYLQWDPIMGPTGPRFMHRVELQVLLPTGDYDRGPDLDPGANILSLDPYWAATLFITPRWTVSWRIHYLWNSRNDDPEQLVFPDANNVRWGQAVHGNLATACEVIPGRLRLGINAYFFGQVTDTEVDGSKRGDLNEEVYAAGPGLVWHLGRDNHLFVNAYREFGAQNRPEGTRINLRFVHHF